MAVRAGERRIQFQARNGLIYIPASVNGNHVTLLLDTGAALTAFSMKIVPVINRDSRITVDTANGSIPAFRIPVAFTLGELNMKDGRCWFRRSVVVGDFKLGEADGVIGLDVLSTFNSATFDFKNSVLVLDDQ
jgi:predicted aspartyl protease